MQAIPEVASSAHNDTTQQILSMEGLVWALDEILNESDIENTPEVRWKPVLHQPEKLETNGEGQTCGLLHSGQCPRQQTCGILLVPNCVRLQPPPAPLVL